MLPVAAFYVRDPHKMTPDVRPMNTYPEGVMFDVLDGKANGYRTFVYTIGEGVEIKHIFTCNRPKLQKPFNELFVDIQREVKLTWQGGQTKLAAGACVWVRISYASDDIRRSVLYVCSWAPPRRRRAC